jgi:hypothetical protein
MHRWNAELAQGDARSSLTLGYSQVIVNGFRFGSLRWGSAVRNPFLKQ